MTANVPHILNETGLEIHQPNNGYRFSVDSILLAQFCRIRPRDRILDLGTGCGIIALYLARMHPQVNITAIEIQDELITLARRNVSRNRLDRRITVIKGDLNQIKELILAQSMDHVVSNPPYRDPFSGRVCKNSSEALARHEILTDIRRVTSAARYALRPGGRFSIVFPAERCAELISLLMENRMEPKRLQMVHPARDKNARMCMIEACRDAGHELHVMPPLFINSLPQGNDQAG